MHGDQAACVWLARFDALNHGCPCEALGLQKALPGCPDRLAGTGGYIFPGKLGRALWGGGVGMLSGLFSDSSTETDVSRGEVLAEVALAGIISGAVIGALVQSERWERLDAPVRTSLTRTRGGPAAVVSIRF